MANNIIEETAIACAYKPGTSLSTYRYHGGHPNKAYAAAVKKAKKKQHAHLSTKRGKGASCDIFPWAIVVSTGVDPKFPSGLSEQKPYLKNHPKKWKRIKNSNARGGDIQHRSNHIQVVVEWKGKRKRANAHYIAHGGTYGCMDGNAHTKNGGGYKTYRSLTAGAATGNTPADKEPSISKIDENYTVKPKNFEDAKDEIYTGEEVVLNPTIRVETLCEDCENIKEFFPNFNPNIDFDNIADLSVKSLINYYQKFVNFLKNTLIESSSLEVGERYFYFLTEESNLPIEIIFNNNIETDKYIFYTSSYEDGIEWMALYLDIYYKYNALLSYEDAYKTYTGVLGCQTFTKGIRQEYVDSYNKQLGSIYIEMQQYKNKAAEVNESFADAINECNKEISLLKADINELQSKMYNFYQNGNNHIRTLNALKIKIQNIKLIFDYFKINNFSNSYTYWNKSIIKNPNQLTYWLEFLDNDSDLSKYFIFNIGDRSYVEENSEVQSIYLRNIPQIIYYEDDDINRVKTGYTYLKIPDLVGTFSNSQQGISAKDKLDMLLYYYSYCSEQIVLNTIPIYYLEPNTIILVYDEKSHINGEYKIEKISTQIGNSQSMSFTASKAVSRIY